MQTFNSGPSASGVSPRMPLAMGRGGGIAGRRKANLNLRDILGPDGIAGSDSMNNAGLGSGVPQSTDAVPMRRNNFTASPFENFEKIV